MALGDSVTAGFGAKVISFLDAKVLQEYRGLSFSIGGDHNAPTIANFLRNYRPDLVGASRGSHLIEVCMAGGFCAPDELSYRPHQDVFNAALSGAVSGTLGLESKYLLGQVTKHHGLNITHDWKLLNVFIGINEICHSSCTATRWEEGGPGSPSDFEQRLMYTISKIRAKLPRLLVNIILLPDMSQVFGFANHHTSRCLHAQPMLRAICPCAMAKGEAGRWAMRQTTAEYNARLCKIARRLNTYAIRESKELQSPRDFAVIISPILKDTDLRHDIPAHFASRLDCFHPSATAHRSLAMAIW
jgi:phospholipase B1